MNQAPALWSRRGHKSASPPSAQRRDEPSSTRQEPAFSVNKCAPDGREKLIGRILVPVDFSAASTEALECAVSRANPADITLSILHVIDINRHALSGTAEELMRNLWAEGSSQLQNLARSLSSKVEAQTMLTEGLPWEVIVEMSQDFDLVVLGRKSRKLSWKPFSQHTAQRVIASAACPVMVLPTPE